MTIMEASVHLVSKSRDGGAFGSFGSVKALEPLDTFRVKRVVH